MIQFGEFSFYKLGDSAGFVTTKPIQPKRVVLGRKAGVIRLFFYAGSVP